MKRHFEYLQHNGSDWYEYPAENWLLAPFPLDKAPIYCNDNLATANRAYFLGDPGFDASHRAACSAWSNCARDISWRLHTFLWAAHAALQGRARPVFWELGTGRGYMLRGLAATRCFENLEAVCFDSFSPNLPSADNPMDIDQATRFAYAQGETDVVELKEAIVAINQIESRKFSFVKGVLPQSLRVATEGASGGIDFLHVDLNHGQSEIACLEMLEDAGMLSRSTTVLFDDTGAPGCEDQARLHRDWVAARGMRGLHLPTGQYLVLAPLALGYS